jgi:hypothetical protein
MQQRAIRHDGRKDRYPNNSTQRRKSKGTRSVWSAKVLLRFVIAPLRLVLGGIAKLY